MFESGGLFGGFFGACKAQDVKGLSDSLDADEADGKIGKIADPISCVPQKVKALKTGIDPKQFSVDVLVRGGDRYSEHRFYDKALMAYKSVLAQAPSNEEALIGQVQALRCLRKMDEAQRACRAALTTVPNSVALKSLQGELTSAAEKKLSGETDAPPAAQKPLYQPGQIWPPIPSPAKDGAPAAAVQDMLLQGAHRFFELCLFEEARLGYASVISQKKNHEQALAGRCHTLWSLEMSTEAVAACEAGLKHIPFSEMLLNCKTKPEAPEVISMTAEEAAEAAAEAEEEDDEVIDLAPLSAEALKRLNFDGDKFAADLDSISQSGKSTTSTKSGKARKKGQGVGADGKKLTRLEQARINVETMPEWTEEKKVPIQQERSRLQEGAELHSQEKQGDCASGRSYRSRGWLPHKKAGWDRREELGQNGYEWRSERRVGWNVHGGTRPILQNRNVQNILQGAVCQIGHTRRQQVQSIGDRRTVLEGWTPAHGEARGRDRGASRRLEEGHRRHQCCGTSEARLLQQAEVPLRYGRHLRCLRSP